MPCLLADPAASARMGLALVLPFVVVLTLALAGGILLFFAVFTPMFVIDQYPCWIGAPNCD